MRKKKLKQKWGQSYQMEQSNEYWRGRYEEVTNWRQQLIEELHKWKIAFGWTLAGLIIALFIAVLR